MLRTRDRSSLSKAVRLARARVLARAAFSDDESDEPTAESEAARLGVPPERAADFAEVYDAVGRRGAGGWERLLAKVRSAGEVERAVDARAAELFAGCPPDDARARAKWRERLVFCGRYASFCAPTPLDDALDTAAAQLRRARELRAELRAADGAPLLRMALSRARFDDEHLACRARAYPYDYPYRVTVEVRFGDALIENM